MLNNLLPKITTLKHLNQIHVQLITQPSPTFRLDPHFISHLIHFLALSQTPNISYAQTFLFHSSNPISKSYNHIIRALSKSDTPREAISFFVQMKGHTHGVRPDKYTFPFLFSVCAKGMWLKQGKGFHCEVVKNGVLEDVYVGNSLVIFYGACRKVRDAMRVFDGMMVRSIVSWNTLMSVYVENVGFGDAVAMFRKMRGLGLKWNVATMVILLSCCAESGNLWLGKWVHCQLVQMGVEMDYRLGTALVDMYAKCGEVATSRMIFKRMDDRERNVLTWTAMIMGLAQHGMAKEALELFSKMRNSKVRPNYVTYLGVLSACSYAGLVEDGYRFFHEMEQVYGIKPMLMHYGAMVDILGRSGRLEEAYKYITKMPCKPDPVIWRTLLSACIMNDSNGSDGVAEKVKRQLLELEPRRCGNLVMVANMYADIGYWNKAEGVRKVMKDKEIKKMSGGYFIEAESSLHGFLAREESQAR